MRGGAAILILTGCGRIWFDPIGDARAGPSDACTFGPWNVPVPIAALASSSEDMGPAISPDELTLYFHSVRLGGGTGGMNLWSSTRASTADPFPGPTPITALNANLNDRDPSVGANGDRLYFTSDRATGSNRDEIFATSRVGATFSTPIASVELGLDLEGPSIRDDELELFYGDAAGILRTTRSSVLDSWMTPMRVTELGTTVAFPTMTGDGLTILLEDSGGTITTASRAAPGAPFSTPEVVPVIGAGFVSVGDPDVSRDGRTLYFSGSTGADGELYVSTRECL